PYSVFISSQVKHLVLIENIGAFGLPRSEAGRAFFADDTVVPTLGQVVRFFWHRLATTPVLFAREQIGLVLGTFQGGGGRWLQVHRSFPEASAARVAKVAAHLFGDLPLVAIVVLSPIGLAVGRRRDISALLTLWILVHLTMTALSGYGGQRFREPIDWT